MARRDQPYLPLYVQDFLTDEKLNECSAEATGVYIKIMCVMHKSKKYGTILLKQKDKQGLDPIKNFSLKLDSHISFKIPVIENAIKELLNEEVLYINGDTLCQKRMIRDNDISEKRALSGKEGGKKTQLAKANAKGKIKANSENENETLSLSLSLKDSNKKKIKHKYGEYKNILLTDAEKEKLKKKFGKDGAIKKIQQMDEGIELKGYKYKSHYLAILKWAKNENRTIKNALSFGERRKNREQRSI